MNYKKISYIILLLIFCFFNRDLYSQNKESVGIVTNVIGKVEILRDGKKIKAEKELEIYETDIINTAENSAVKLNFKDGSNFMGFQNTEFKVAEYKVTKKKSGGVNTKSFLDIAKGSVRYFVKPKEDGANDAKVTTPNAVMLIRGTTIDIDGEKLIVINTSPGKDVLYALKKDLTRWVSVTQGFAIMAKEFKVRKVTAEEIKLNEERAAKSDIGAIPHTFENKGGNEGSVRSDSVSGSNEGGARPDSVSGSNSKQDVGHTQPLTQEDSNTQSKQPVIINTDGTSNSTTQTNLNDLSNKNSSSNSLETQTATQAAKTNQIIQQTAKPVTDLQNKKIQENKKTDKSITIIINPGVP